jgi:hypothetical protein
MATKEGYLGIRERFLEIEESTYGTAPSFSSSNLIGDDVIVTPAFEQGFQERKSSGTDTRTVEDQTAGPLSLPYSLAWYPRTWRMLKYVFDIGSETGSGTYTHNLVVSNAPKSFSAEWAMRHGTDPLVFKLTGCVVNDLNIAFSKASGSGNDGFVTCSAECFAQNYSTPASIESCDFTQSGDAFQYRHFGLTLNSGDVVPINSGSIKISQGFNMNDARYASSGLGRTIGVPIATVFRISGSFNLNLFETDFVDLWETAAAIGGTNQIVFEQSSSNKVTFALTNMYINPVPVSGTNIEGINTGDFVWTATGITVAAIDDIASW